MAPALPLQPGRLTLRSLAACRRREAPRQYLLSIAKPAAAGGAAARPVLCELHAARHGATARLTGGERPRVLAAGLFALVRVPEVEPGTQLVTRPAATRS